MLLPLRFSFDNKTMSFSGTPSESQAFTVLIKGSTQEMTLVGSKMSCEEGLSAHSEMLVLIGDLEGVTSMSYSLAGYLDRTQETLEMYRNVPSPSRR